MADPTIPSDAFRWTDVFLARSRSDDPRLAGVHLLLIVLWHWTVFPATIAAVDWLLGYGASVNGVPVPPRAFDWGRAIGYVVDPIMACALLTVLLVEALLSWFTFRIFMRRRRTRFRLFAHYWWKVCVWGVVGLPLACVGFALLSRNYDAAMNFPLLWVLCGVIFPTVLCPLNPRSRFAIGHCQHCGYDLTGNVSGRCSECGALIEQRRETMRDTAAPHP